MKKLILTVVCVFFSYYANAYTDEELLMHDIANQQYQRDLEIDAYEQQLIEMNFCQKPEVMKRWRDTYNKIPDFVKNYGIIVKQEDIVTDILKIRTNTLQCIATVTFKGGKKQRLSWLTTYYFGIFQ